MKKYFLCSLVALTATILVASPSTVEARHSRCTSMHVGVGSAYAQRDVQVVRRATRPVVVAPMYAPPAQYYYVPYGAPVYGAPVYVYPPQTYVEEVYIPRQAPVGLTGLSFSWNFFK